MTSGDQTTTGSVNPALGRWTHTISRDRCRHRSYPRIEPTIHSLDRTSASAALATCKVEFGHNSFFCSPVVAFCASLTSVRLNCRVSKDCIPPGSGTFRLLKEQHSEGSSLCPGSFCFGAYREISIFRILSYSGYSAIIDAQQGGEDG